MEKEERELQIRLAKLNAYVQICHATFLAALAVTLTLVALAYQNPSSGIDILIFGLVFLGIAGYFLYKLIKYLHELENLQ